MLGARDLGKLAGYNVIISSGTLLGAVGLQQPAVTAGALAYLVISTLGIGALFLVAGLLTPEGEEEDDDAFTLEPYEPVGGDGRSEEHTSELQSLMRISYAVFCLQKTIRTAEL